MTIKQLILSIIFLAVSYLLQSQDTPPIPENKNNKTDTFNTIIDYSELGAYYIYIKPDSSIKYYKKALNLAKQFDNDSLLNVLYISMGNTYESKGKLDSAILFYNIFYKRVQNKRDSNLNVLAYNNLGNVYYYKSEYNLALDYYQRAFTIFEMNNDSSNIGLISHNIGLVHDDKGDTKVAKEYYEKAKDIFIRLNDVDLLATCYNSLASIYLEEGKNDTAYLYYQTSLKLFKDVADSIGVCMVYANIGDFKISINEIDSAIFYMKKSADLAYNLNDWISLSGVYESIANLNLEQKKYYISIIFANKSLKYAKLSSSLVSQLGSYKILKKANYLINNYRDALLYSDSVALIKDSIINIEKLKDFELMESRFQAKNKELEIQNLQKEQELSKERNEKQKQQLFYLLILIFLFLVFTAFIIKLLIHKQKTNKELEINKNNLTEKNEELNQLIEEVTAQKDEINNQKQKIETIYTDLSESISYAQKIQNAIIPKSNLLKNFFTDSFIIFKPKDVVSGDFYWFTKIEDNIIIALSDCTGHGVPGAFMSMIGVSFLREIIEKEKIIEPDKILFRLREEIINSLNQTEEIGGQKDGMDISIININTKTLELQYAGANSPLYLIKNGELKIKNESSNSVKLYELEESSNFKLYEVKPDKMPIAIFTRMDKFSKTNIQLNKGDIIYMFSDGFADQFGGEKGKKFKYKTFRKMLIKNCSNNMDIQKENILLSLYNWQGSYNQIDDITLLGIKI